MAQTVIINNMVYSDVSEIRVPLLSGGTARFVDTDGISEVVLTTPESGTRTFSVTVPDGDGTKTYVYTIDRNGNVSVAEN